MATVSTLIDYLGQFDPNDRVVLTTDDVEEPCEFIALDIALAQIDDHEPEED